MTEMADMKITAGVGIGSDVGFCITVNTAMADWLDISFRVVVAFEIFEPSWSNQQLNV